MNLFEQENEKTFTEILREINLLDKNQKIKLIINKELEKNDLNEIIKCILRIEPKQIFIETNLSIINKINKEEFKNEKIHYIINIDEKNILDINIEDIKNSKYSFRIKDTELKKRLESFDPYNIFIYEEKTKEKTINEKIKDNILEPINKRLGLEISLDEVYRLMIRFEENSDFWEVVEKIGYPLPIIIEVLEGLEKLNLIEINNLDIKIKYKFSRELKQIQDFSKQRLSSNEDYCQLLVNQNDLIRRIQFIRNCCRTGGKIAILGDDDFMSLNIATTNIFDKITVFEIDQRIVDKLNELAKQNNLNLVAIQQDLRKPFPNKFKEKFDAFYTDSTYCVNGFKLFISRGIELLKNEPKCHGFVSFSPEIPVIYDTELPVQKLINEMNLFIERKNLGAVNIVPDEFKEKYNNIDKLRENIFINYKIINNNEAWYLACFGRKEYLYHLLTTKNTKSLLDGEFKEEIYFTKRPLEFYNENFEKTTNKNAK